MKAKLSFVYTKLLSALLVMLGFAACDTDGKDEYGTPSAEYGTEYGTPSAIYKIKGKVVARATRQPIAGISVFAEQGTTYLTATDHKDTTVYNSYSRTESRTDTAGAFDMQIDGFPNNDAKFRVTFEDTDSIDNGGFFAARQDTATISRSQLQNGSGNWYAGEATWDLGTVELEPQQ
ncbi:MAG: radical SAM-associated putative lipoprotein [Prevotellaceae bacterium]|jgi:putative lipoprotein (rSAM/lipoprotein system)|nr:radical SAM-associated putative lipoprotein [Prevotellaceae bacterium]